MVQRYPCPRENSGTRLVHSRLQGRRVKFLEIHWGFHGVVMGEPNLTSFTCVTFNIGCFPESLHDVKVPMTRQAKVFAPFSKRACRRKQRFIEGQPKLALNVTGQTSSGTRIKWEEKHHIVCFVCLSLLGKVANVLDMF